MKKKSFVSYTLYAFSQAELKRLLAVCAHMEDYIMILLASRYGFRREDIVKIEVNNIDLKNATLTFYEKKKKRSRSIPIEQDVVQEITKYKNTFGKKRQYLFPFQDGSTAWRHLQDLCMAAEIPIPIGREGRPFHSLRGTCVKMRQAQGWTLNEVGALIGDEPETVAEHYATVTPSELATKMNRS